MKQTSILFLLIAISNVLSLHGQGVSWDIASVQVYRVDGAGELWSLLPQIEPRSANGVVVGPPPFSTLTTGRYRMDGVLGPNTAILSPHGAFSSANGLTARIILTTKTYTGDPVAGKQIIRLTSTDQHKVLSLGHDAQSWILGRSMNSSPFNPVLDPLRTFWMTPWDPVYDIPETTVIVYYRISPIGVAYIDRFMPYYDNNNVLRLSWEEGVQLAAWTWGVIGVGTPATNPPSSTTNPPTPDPVTFANGYLGGADVNDLIKSVRLKSASITVEEMFNDVKALIPATASILTSPAMKPCNDGLWLMKEIHETPCGPFVTYAPSIGTGPHYGPPTNRIGYKTGTSSNFAPAAVTITSSNISAGLSFSWQSAGSGTGYNYAVLDTTTTNQPVFVDGGTINTTTYTLGVATAGHKYTIYVAPYNDMGVGPSSSIEAQYIPLGPAGTSWCAYEAGVCAVEGSKFISYGTKDNFITRFVQTSQNVSCTVTFFGGDPAIGYPKSCFIGNQPSGYHCANEGSFSYCPLNGVQTVWFGSSYNYISRPMNGMVGCNVTTFGFDPAPGLPKSCFTTSTMSTFSGPPGFLFSTTAQGGTPSGPSIQLVADGIPGVGFFTYAVATGNPSTSSVCTGTYSSSYLNSCFTYVDPSGLAVLPPSYTFCAANGGVCTFPGPAYAAYGFASSFRIKKVSDGISCTAAAFGDPNPQPYKMCYLMPVSHGTP